MIMSSWQYVISHGERQFIISLLYITVFYCNIIKWKACAFSTMEPKFSQCGNFILLQPENHILYDNSEIIQYNSLETIWYTITWKRMTLQPGIYLIFYFENQWIYNIEPCELATWKPYNFTYKKCYTKERSYDCLNQQRGNQFT